MIVVAGHVCLDVIPRLPRAIEPSEGALFEVGPATFSVGGAVGNVGGTLARLGVPARLLGRVGEDPFGDIVTGLLAERGGRMASTAEAATSYSIVISPPAGDRYFLHHTGCNDGFGGDELRASWPGLRDEGARLVHFGYPPIMRRTFEDGGVALAEAFQTIRRDGAWVTLDMSTPDPEGASGTVDWADWLKRVLPHVDAFMPSWLDLAGMLPGVPSVVSAAAVRDAAATCLSWGAGAVLLKMGEEGLYLRTGSGDALPAVWRERELASPNFRVDVQGTTGAGDATIAGFLAGMVRGEPPEEASRWASAVGAYSVEGLDATSRVPDLAVVRRRIGQGWARMGPGVIEGEVDASGIVRGHLDEGSA